MDNNPIINAGTTGPVPRATLDAAKASMDRFSAELTSCGAVVDGWRLRSGSGEQGRWPFELTVNGTAVQIDMPGLPAEQLIFDPNPHSGDRPSQFPRLYINGSSWWWPYALDQALDAATPDDQQSPYLAWCGFCGVHLRGLGYPYAHQTWDGNECILHLGRPPGSEADHGVKQEDLQGIAATLVAAVDHGTEELTDHQREYIRLAMAIVQQDFNPADLLALAQTLLAVVGDDGTGELTARQHELIALARLLTTPDEDDDQDSAGPDQVEVPR